MKTKVDVRITEEVVIGGEEHDAMEFTIAVKRRGDDDANPELRVTGFGEKVVFTGSLEDLERIAEAVRNRSYDWGVNVRRNVCVDHGWWKDGEGHKETRRSASSALPSYTHETCPKCPPPVKAELALVASDKEAPALS